MAMMGLRRAAREYKRAGNAKTAEEHKKFWQVVRLFLMGVIFISLFKSCVEVFF